MGAQPGLALCFTLVSKQGVGHVHQILVLRCDANDPVGDIRREPGAQLVRGILLSPRTADHHMDIGCRAQNLLKEWQAAEVPGFVAELRMKHAVEVQKECAHRKSIGCSWLAGWLAR